MMCAISGFAAGGIFDHTGLFNKAELFAEILGDFRGGVTLSLALDLNHLI